MKTSEQITELATALAKVQSEICNPSKSGVNPHFKSRYATLPDILKAVTSIAPMHDLCFTSAVDSERKTCITTIYHKSGQFIQDEIPLILGSRNNMQEFGSALTYARRYSLQNLFGLAGDEKEDDDGNACSRPAPKRQNAPKTNPVLDSLRKIIGAKTDGFLDKEKTDNMLLFLGLTEWKELQSFDNQKLSEMMKSIQAIPLKEENNDQ